ncbi:MAG: GntR family transcriptional regulator [Acidimicrobiia bacterium]
MAPIERETTASVIARRLRTAIVDGNLPPGTQLTESRLAEQLGVSRAPVREALQRLIQEGLAESRRRGVFVHELTAADITDIYLARTACESAAVLRIIDSQPPDASRLMQLRLEELRSAAATGDWTATGFADRTFHETLVDLAGSPRLTRMFATLLVETSMCLRDLEHSSSELTALVAEHEEIVHAIEAGDADRVVRAVRTHMDSAEASLRLRATDRP